MENIDSYTEMLTPLAMTYGPKLVMIVLTLVIGFPVIGLLGRLLRR